MLNTSHRKWSGRRGAFRDRKGQREDEVNKPEDAENQDEFDEVSICYSFVEKFLLIPQALKVPLMLNSEHMAPYPEWMEHVPYPPSYQIPLTFSGLMPEMTHWLIWCIFNKSVG